MWQLMPEWVSAPTYDTGGDVVQTFDRLRCGADVGRRPGRITICIAPMASTLVYAHVGRLLPEMKKGRN